MLEFSGADIRALDPIVGEPVSAKLKCERGQMAVVELNPWYEHLSPEYLPLIRSEDASSLAVELTRAAQRELEAMPSVDELLLTEFSSEVLRFEVRNAPTNPPTSAPKSVAGHLVLEWPSFATIEPVLYSCWIRLCTEYERNYLASLHCNIDDETVAIAIAADPVIAMYSHGVHFAVGTGVKWVPSGTAGA